MQLTERIKLLHRSSERMMDALKLERDEPFWFFMRREIWIHLKRTLELVWAVLKKKQ